MSKGSSKRKCQVSREVENTNWEEAFGKKKLNIMSDKDREEMLEELITIEQQEQLSKTKEAE